MKKLNNIPTPQNDDAWAEALDGVRKIAQPEAPPEAPLIIEEVIPTVNYAKAYSGAALNPLEIGQIDNVDRRLAMRFCKGELKIERRLDLHGLFEKDAAEAVDAFIRNAYLQKLRCVLIITGKGMNKETDQWYEKKGILKECVPVWLNSAELRPLILGISQAKVEDGGSGALYILLRRHRGDIS